MFHQANHGIHSPKFDSIGQVRAFIVDRVADTPLLRLTLAAMNRSATEYFDEVIVVYVNASHRCFVV